ncbi:MAG: NUDIX domain-containing protein [Alphaproteobacteria bacterium]|nr:NUDIX domain-containing protein [Alphaproteobacteria bacterium]
MKRSAGILLWRRKRKEFEFFLVHPGGPFWRNRDAAAWTIPKGAIEPEEEPLAAARREFAEETGFAVDGDFLELGDFKQPGGKHVLVWALEGDCDAARLVSLEFEMEWPPRSGKRARFPEVDRGGWFGVAEARGKLLVGQRPMLDTFLKRMSKA